MHKVLALYGFDYSVLDQAVPADAIETTTLLNLSYYAPEFVEGAVGEDLSAHELASLRRILALATPEIIASEAEVLIVFGGRGRQSSTFFLIGMIARLLPGVRVVLAGKQCRIESAVNALKSQLAQRVVREDSLLELIPRLEAIFDDPARVQGPKTFWKSESGEVRWNGASRTVEGQEEVLLVLMPAWNNDFLPFGLAHISSALRGAKFNVTVLDLNQKFWRHMKTRFENCSEYENIHLWTQRERYDAEVRPFLDETFRQLGRAVEEGRYAYVGFSVFLTNLHATHEALEVVRKNAPHAKIFTGGPSCDEVFVEPAFKAGTLDAGVFGEGEFSAIALLEAWREGAPIEKPIAGVSVRGGSNEILRGPVRPLADANALPLPDYDAFDLYDYELYTLPIFFSRGCVAKCTFCSETQFWVKYRSVAYERVVAAIKRGIDEYGFSSFQVNDSLMNGNHAVLESIADEIIRQGLKISYVGYCRLDRKMTAELLRKVYRSGCRRLFFGLESGSQKILNSMKKGVRVQDFGRILRDAAEAGIHNYVCVIVGFPGETWIDFAKTLVLIVRLRRYISDVNLSVLSLAPDAALYADQEKHGIVFENHDNSRSWSTQNGRNTQSIRYLRYRILKFAWWLVKRKPTSPRGWDFEYQMAQQ